MNNLSIKLKIMQIMEDEGIINTYWISDYGLAIHKDITISNSKKHFCESLTHAWYPLEEVLQLLPKKIQCTENEVYFLTVTSEGVGYLSERSAQLVKPIIWQRSLGDIHTACLRLWLQISMQCKTLKSGKTKMKQPERKNETEIGDGHANQ